MKISSLLSLIVITLVLVNCDKSKEAAKNHVNCDGLITDTLGTGDNAKIYMPNAFSPNDDGINDICRPITRNVALIVFTIYDCDNNVVFNTTSLQEGWHPASGPHTWTTYYYKIQVATEAGHHIGVCGEVYSLSCFPGSMPRSSFCFEDQFMMDGFTGVTMERIGTCP
ncbi:MAG: gliding motility-associated C-terminal domain-containing protein [Bacteroidetes bacterium]|nr:gliding motility-associated C-terminal domain-containing protein [Bacteroidota bacterium]